MRVIRRTCPRGHRDAVAALALAFALLACVGDDATPADDDDDTGADGGFPGDDAGVDASFTGVVYQSTFGDDGAWPAPWTAIGGVAEANVAAGRARLRPTLSSYSLARMYLPGDERDVDVTLRAAFEDIDTTGLGFYVRSSGGYLTQTEPRGQGYAVFIEGYRDQQGIGLWRELDGQEQEIEVAWSPQPPIVDGADVAVRFQVLQEGDATRLRARIWPADAAEPAAWSIDLLDDAPVLQGSRGGFAVDCWSNRPQGGPASVPVAIDELAIRGVE
jgi:hypothetical protein